MKKNIADLSIFITPWKILESRHIIKDKWISLRSDSCINANNIPIEPYYVLEGKDSVNIIAVNELNQVLVTCQYRHAANLISFEFPCGEIEEGESPEEAAHRELLEETGCSYSRLIYAGSFFSNPAKQNSKVYTFVALGVKCVSKQNLDSSESIQCSFISLDEFKTIISKGLFSQGLHLGSWYQATEVLPE